MSSGNNQNTRHVWHGDASQPEIYKMPRCSAPFPLELWILMCKRQQVYVGPAWAVTNTRHKWRPDFSGANLCKSSHSWLFSLNYFHSRAKALWGSFEAFVNLFTLDVRHVIINQPVAARLWF
jgi:hypothetical protein